MQNSLHRDLFSLIKSSCTRKTYKPGAVLMMKGEPVTRFLIIHKGRAKLVERLEDGRNYILFYTRDNEPLGDVEFFSEGESTVTISTLTECEVFSIELETLRQMARSNPEIYEKMGESVAFKLRRGNHKNLVNLIYPLKERLAGYIYSQVTGATSDDIRGDSLRDMADLMGTSYRHLNRVILQLCNEGYVKRNRWGITVANREGLRELAGDALL